METTQFDILDYEEERHEDEVEFSMDEDFWERTYQINEWNRRQQ